MRVLVILVAGFLSLGIAGNRQAVQTRTPATITEAFLNRIGKGEVGAAYDELLQGSTMAAQTIQVDALKRQTEVALPVYGKVLGFELYREDHFGDSLVRRVYLQRLEKHPIVWHFWVYKPITTWQISAVLFNDQMMF